MTANENSPSSVILQSGNDFCWIVPLKLLQVGAGGAWSETSVTTQADGCSSVIIPLQSNWRILQMGMTCFKIGMDCRREASNTSKQINWPCRKQKYFRQQKIESRIPHYHFQSSHTQDTRIWWRNHQKPIITKKKKKRCSWRFKSSIAESTD